MSDTPRVALFVTCLADLFRPSIGFAAVKLLETMDASMKKLDVHLASLRETLKSIDKTIPFLSLGTDDEEETPEGETPEPGAESGSEEVQSDG